MPRQEMYWSLLLNVKHTWLGRLKEHIPPAAKAAIDFASHGTDEAVPFQSQFKRTSTWSHGTDEAVAFQNRFSAASVARVELVPFPMVGGRGYAFSARGSQI